MATTIKLEGEARSEFGSTVNGSASLSSAAGSWCVFSVITSYFFLTLAARKPPYGVCAVRLWRELCCILLHTHVLLVWQSSHGEKTKKPAPFSTAAGFHVSVMF